MSWAVGTSFDPPGAALHQSPVQQTSPLATSPVADIDSAGRKRKRGSTITENGEEHGRASMDSSLLGGESPVTGKQRHQPGVKRACNDCRQQKVRAHTSTLGSVKVISSGFGDTP